MTDLAARISPASSGPAQRQAALLLAALGTAAVTLGLLVVFHDRFWYPPDEGAYGHLARQVLRGAVLHRDWQDIHAGYVNFANAAALWLFGDDLASLRYPLAAMGFVQAMLAFRLFRERGPMTAAAAALGLTCLTLLNYLDPSAHWYALCLTMATICAAAYTRPDGRWRLELLGFLIVAVFLFRQLTGVFVAIGLVAYLLHTLPGGATARRPLLARLLVAVMALGLCGYLLTTGQATNIVLFAAPTLMALAAVFLSTRLDDRGVLAMTLRLGLGGAAAALPLVAYLAYHGAFAAWYDDIVLAAAGQTRLGFIRNWYHLAMLVESGKAILALEGPRAILNALAWIALLAMPPLNGVLLYHAIRRGDALARHPLPFVAVFYSLVAVHHQNATYLAFTVGPVVLGFLWLTRAGDRGRRLAPTLLVLAMALVQLTWQSAQPAWRTIAQIARGEMLGAPLVRGPAPGSLLIEATDAARYGDLLALIRRETGPGDRILALPNNPELYYLADRRSAVRFFNSGLGLRDMAEAEALMRQLAEDPPVLVLHDPKDKYNTAESDAVIAFLRQRYRRLAPVGGLDVYRPARP